MAKASRSREQILNDFQSITLLNIEDAIHFLDEYNWDLPKITNDFFHGINLNRKIDHDPSLGRYYADENESSGDDNERHYKKILEKNDDESEQPIYHEKQRLSRCGLHSLNNLFQIPKLFTRHHLEAIVREYDKRTFFNDYRTLWFGNYDLRILIEAIHRCGFDVQQIDVYRDDSLVAQNWDSFFGLLINLNGEHWFTIKNLHGIYYNLDSTLRKPLEIGDKTHLINYLSRLIERTARFYLFVVSQSTSKC